MVSSPSDRLDDAEMAYAQAKRYSQDLVRIYKEERAKRLELEIANQKLNAVWATAPNGLAVLDEQMRVVQANPRFEALVESVGGCAGQLLVDLLPSPELAEHLSQAARNGTPFRNVEVTLTRSTPRTLQVNGASLAAGALRGWVISVFDLTERKRLEGLKEEFIDIAAHELRTPLAIILGFASVLSEDMAQAHDPDALAPVEAIVGAANRLKMIINELVEFAAAKGRSVGPGADQFDLWNTIDHAVSTLSQQASQAGIEISVCPPGQALPARGDRVMMAQALVHLLENAIKYNRPGGRVQVRAFRQNDETIVEIEDTGIGIPAAEIERIFDMFYQVEEHLTRAQGGLGMGLSIARRAIELHGGQIQVSSSVGRGSCFRVILPPPSQQPDIIPEVRLDTAHQQMLAYGRDLARAYAAQRALAQKVRRLCQVGQELDQALASGHIAEARRLAASLASEATVADEPRNRPGSR
jgi:two-component system phosphate regulon sensor histidine kinase PhoR